MKDRQDYDQNKRQKKQTKIASFMNNYHKWIFRILHNELPEYILFIYYKNYKMYHLRTS